MNRTGKKKGRRSSPPVVFRVAGLPVTRPALLVSIFVFAFLLRAAYLLEFRVSPHWDILTLDTHVHDLLAREISQKDFFGHAPFFRSPLYPYLLGIVYAVFGPGLLVPRFINILCGALSCVLLYRIGERVFRPAVGLAASGLASVYWVFIYIEGELLLVAVYVFLLLLSLHLLLESEGRRPKKLMLSGLVLGLATITRPNVLVYFPFALIGLALDRSTAWKERMKRAALFLAPPLVIIGGVMARNHYFDDGGWYIAYQAGVNFYIGNNHQAKGHAAETPYNINSIPDNYRWRHRDNIWMNDDVWFAGYYLAEKESGRSLKPSEFQRFWFKRAFRDMWDHKAEYLRLVGRKIYYLLNAYEIPSNKNPYLFIREHSRLLGALSILDFGMIVSFGILGILASLGRGRQAFLLYTFVIVYAATNVAFFINTRFRIPFVPILMVFAVHFPFWIASRLKAGARLEPIAALVLCAGLLGFTHTEWFNLKDHTLQSVLHYNLGTALAEKGRHEAAAREFEESIRLYPEVPNPYRNLCAALNQWGEYDQAVEWAEKGLLRFPEDWKIRLHLGTAYLRKGEAERAARELETVVAAAPGSDVASINLGIAYYETGDLERAAERFEKTLEIITQNRLIHFIARLHLGFIGLKKGEYGPARAAFEEALKIIPNDIDALLHLAEAHLGLEDREAARSVLDRVLKLAEAQIHREDRKDVRTTLEEVLRLDPENERAKALLGSL